MVKQTQTIRLLLLKNCLSVFDHFAGLALKGFEYFDLPIYNGVLPCKLSSRPWLLLRLWLNKSPWLMLRLWLNKSPRLSKECGNHGK